jgi:hypothetical protein
MSGVGTSAARTGADRPTASSPAIPRSLILVGRRGIRREPRGWGTWDGRGRNGQPVPSFL